jgi:hypothetical protein
MLRAPRAHTSACTTSAGSRREWGQAHAAGGGGERGRSRQALQVELQSCSDTLAVWPWTCPRRAPWADALPPAGTNGCRRHAS